MQTPFRTPVFASAAAAVLVRVWLVGSLGAPAADEGTRILHLAAALRDGNGLVHADPGAPGWVATAEFPVGYPALVALVASLGPDLLSAARTVNVAGAALGSAAAAWIAGSLLGPRGAWVAGLWTALLPGALLWSAAVMPQTLAAGLLAGAVSVAVGPGSGTSVPDVRRWVLAGIAGLFVGAATLVTPWMILTAPFVGGLPPGRTRARGGAALVCTMLALAVAVPWSLRNCVLLDACSFVSTENGARLLDGVPREAARRERLAEKRQECLRAGGEVAADRCRTRHAWRAITADPVQWGAVGTGRAVTSALVSMAPAAYLAESLPERFDGPPGGRVKLLCTLAWWSMLAAAVIGARRLLRLGGSARAMVRITALTCLLQVALSFVFAGDDRTVLAAVPLLSVLAAGLLLPADGPPPPDFEMVPTP